MMLLALPSRIALDKVYKRYTNNTVAVDASKEEFFE
jgi:hypothetical protein